MKNKHWNKNVVTACLFIFVLFTYTLFNGMYAAEKIDRLSEDLSEGKSLTENVKSVNDFVNDNVSFYYQIIESYGIIQKGMLKREFNNFNKVVDKQGYLYSGNFYNDFSDNQKIIAADIRRLKDYAERYGTEFFFVTAPMKTVSKEDAYIGIPYSNPIHLVEDLECELRYYGVPYLNLSNLLTESLSFEESFYKTDPHWKTKAVLYGYSDIISWMEEQYKIVLDAGRRTRNLSNYTVELYPKLMFGSEGRNTGQFYSGGGEDFEVYYPKNNGSYTVEISNRETRSGGFYGTLVQADIDQKIKNIYKDNCYDLTFLYDFNDSVRILNHENNQGTRILLLGDSHGLPLACYMAQNFSQVDVVSMLEDDKDEILTMIMNNDYDYVMMFIYPENLTYQNMLLFGEGKNE